MKRKQKIMVGLSGGVDSSVAAALLRNQGYDVYGVFIKVWQTDFLPCDWRGERREAMRAAAHLGIPFLTLDLEKEYKAGVVDYLIREYARGRTPNPDVMCNKEIKFGAFLSFAEANGMDAIATGHYAIRTPERDGTISLCESNDSEKDQSYFLWKLQQQQLRSVLFPLGTQEKSSVRAMARKLGLPNADKKDSQGICFLGAIDMSEFLKHFVQVLPGNVLDALGNVIGSHEGSILYTIGQRHGFRVHKHQENAQPLYVISKDVENNTITVANHLKEAVSQTTEITLEDVSWVSPLSISEIDVHTLGMRYRYHGTKLPLKALTLSGKNVKVQLHEGKHDIASGQSCVIYRGKKLLGGGIVC